MVMCACIEEQAKNQHLALEVERLQQSFDWIADSFAFTGHELRNGLFRLRLITEKLERDTALTAEQKLTVARATKAARGLEFMALNCLNLAEIESGNFAPSCSTFDPIAEIITPLIDDYADMLDIRQQTVEIATLDGDLHIQADADLLQLVINNLLNNAIKYGAQGGKIIIQTQRASNGAAEISVWNNGEGIAPQICEQLFDRFQTSGEMSFSPSSGIGLYLVKRIMEAHRGVVYCESKVGEWARFSIQFPR